MVYNETALDFILEAGRDANELDDMGRPALLAAMDMTRRNKWESR